MIKAILFDISGVLHVDREPIPGAVAALRQLKQTAYALRFVTNTSRSTCNEILAAMTKMGFDVEPSQVFTAPLAMKQVIKSRGLRPYCLIHPDLEPEFADIEKDHPNAVVIADAAERFDYAHLNHAFRLILDGAPLFGIGRNRYFKSEGKMQLDAGPFIQALEYATGSSAEILGKPAAGFFHAAVESMGCKPDEVIMIGDDVEADVIGAMQAGLNGCLVQTGKYRAGDEKNAPGAMFVSSVVEALNILTEDRTMLSN